MNVPPEEDSDSQSQDQKWPWWEPYVVTGCIAAAFIAFLMVCGYIGRIPFVEHVLFVLMTIAAVVAAVRRSTTVFSLAGSILLFLFFALASLAYLLEVQLLLGIGYAVLAGVWLCLSINAGVTRHRQKGEGSAKLDRAVETLRRAIQDEE